MYVYKKYWISGVMSIILLIMFCNNCNARGNEEYISVKVIETNVKEIPAYCNYTSDYLRQLTGVRVIVKANDGSLYEFQVAKCKYISCIRDCISLMKKLTSLKKGDICQIRKTTRTFKGNSIIMTYYELLDDIEGMMLPKL